MRAFLVTLPAPVRGVVVVRFTASRPAPEVQPVDCSLPGSSARGISQARVLERLLFGGRTLLRRAPGEAPPVLVRGVRLRPAECETLTAVRFRFLILVFVLQLFS